MSRPLRPHTGGTEPIPVESQSERKIRIFLAVMFFFQTFLTPLPFMYHVNDEGKTDGTISALQFLLQSEGVASDNGFVAIYGLLLIALPITAFFFCIFDKRSRVKYLVTAITSVVCAVIVTFTCGRSVSYGAVLTLIINVITLFMTSQGAQAVTIRMSKEIKK